MAASVVWEELNGSEGTVTEGITNLNFGSADVPNLDTAQYPIMRGQPSYDKWVRLHFSGSFYRISRIQVWRGDGSGGAGPSLPSGVVLTGEAGYSEDLTYSPPSPENKNLSTFPSDPEDALPVGPEELLAEGRSYLVHLQLLTAENSPTGPFSLGYIEFSWLEE